MAAIDLTDRFTGHQRLPVSQWQINRTTFPFRNIAIHHTGSTMVGTIPYAYGVRTDGGPVSQAAEESAVLALANDHRDRFGIGPGYMGVVFQSGRGYWVGKAGTVRRHTSNTYGRLDGKTWNFDTVAIVVFGNLGWAEISPALLAGIVEMCREVLTGWGTLVKHPVRIFGHSDVFNTECPGDGGRAIVRHLNTRFGELYGGSNLGFAPPPGGKSSDTANLALLAPSGTWPLPPLILAPPPPSPPLLPLVTRDETIRDHLVEIEMHSSAIRALLEGGK